MKITKSQLRRVIKEELLKEFAGITGGRESHGDPYAADRAQRSKFDTEPNLHPWQIKELLEAVLEAAGFDKRARAGMFQNTDGKRILDHMYLLGTKSDGKQSRQFMEAFLNGESTHGQSKELYELLPQFRK